MIQLKMVEFTHANLNKRVLVVPTNVFTVYFGDADKSTHIVSVAGTVFPVTESVEEVRRAIEEALGAGDVKK